MLLRGLIRMTAATIELGLGAIEAVGGLVVRELRRIGDGLEDAPPASTPAPAPPAADHPSAEPHPGHAATDPPVRPKPPRGRKASTEKPPAAS